MNKIYVTTGAVATETESVKKYMGEIKKTPLLSREQEQSATRNELVSSNLRFVVQVAKQYQGMGLELEDLIAFGNIGLFEAAERFDPTRNIKFITFAVWYVRAEITKALNDMGRTVRIPSHRTATEEYSTISTQTVIGEDEDSETYADRFLEAERDTSAQDLRDLRDAIATALSKLKPKVFPYLYILVTLLAIIALVSSDSSSDHISECHFSIAAVSEALSFPLKSSYSIVFINFMRFEAYILIVESLAFGLDFFKVSISLPLSIFIYNFRFNFLGIKS